MEDLEIDETQAKENYLILLLGSADSPIKSKIHLQKEMFILSNSFPKIRDLFIFDKHFFGPWNEELEQIVESPSFYENPFNSENGKFYLTKEGKEIYNKLLKDNNDNINFQYLLSGIKLVRAIYDKITPDELMLLIYLEYPDFKINSEKYKELVENKQKKRKLLNELLKKGIISEEKYKEYE